MYSGDNGSMMPTTLEGPDSHQGPATLRLLKPVQILAGFTKVTEGGQ